MMMVPKGSAMQAGMKAGKRPPVKKPVAGKGVKTATSGFRVK